MSDIDLFLNSYISFIDFYIVRKEHINLLDDNELYNYYLQYGNDFLDNCTHEAAEIVFKRIANRLRPFNTNVITTALLGLRYGAYCDNDIVAYEQILRGHPVVVNNCSRLKLLCEQYPHLVRYLDIRCTMDSRAKALSIKWVFKTPTDVKFEV